MIMKWQPSGGGVRMGYGDESGESGHVRAWPGLRPLPSDPGDLAALAGRAELYVDLVPV